MSGTRRERAGGPEPIRTFIALVPPAELREALVAWQRSALAGRDALRAVPGEGLHLTLAVLGELERGEVERAGELLAGLEPRPVALVLEGRAVPLPRRRPRVLAFPVSSPGAVALQEELAARLGAAGLPGPEGRRFRPHLSVARVRGRRGAAGLDRRTLRDLPTLAAPPAAAARTFDAVRVALYRSQLRSQGARYDALAAIDLPPAGGG